MSNLLNIILGFFEGLALIVSPCILPILPIILAGSLTGSKKKPFGIIVGFVIIFALFTFFSRQLVRYSAIDTNLIRHVSYGILVMLGIIMLSDYLSEKFSEIFNPLINTGSRFFSKADTTNGFGNGLLLGSLIAIIWTPCAGPILAAVIVQTVIEKTTAISFLIVLSFGLGAAIPMLAIALLGRKIMEKMNLFRRHAILIRKLLGIIIIISVGYMVIYESRAFTATPTTNNNKSTIQLDNGLANPYPSPQIAGISAWINSNPLSLQDLKGKVVLIDFWTYSCINCLRTLPYLKDWYQKYHSDGFVIIGIHSPEFEFEKDFNNVKNAVEREGILYPVALDNQFVTWQNFNNQYWPAHFLLDKNGNVVYTHFGEGEYDTTEKNIQYLLGKNPNSLSTSKLTTEPSSSRTTPETYLGYARSEKFVSPESMIKNTTARYTLPKSLLDDAWALQGLWKINPDNIVSADSNSILKINFHAKKVFIVMGNATEKPIRVKILLNGKPLTTEAGNDVTNSHIQVDKHRLYEVISLPESRDGILELIALEPGLEVYTFTFGG